MLHTKKPAGFQPKFTIAFCICECEGEILVLKRQVGKGQENEWGVPAGKLEPGEKAIEAAQRELYEETGIHRDLSDFVHTGTFYDEFPSFSFVVEVFYLDVSTKPPVRISPVEHQEFRWVTPQQAVELDHMLDVDHILHTQFPESFTKPLPPSHSFS